MFEDETALTGQSSITWQAIPGRLDFTVANVRTETAAVAQIADTPNNRQVTSSTRAGPTLRFRVRSVDELQVQFLYTDESNEIEDTDATRETGTVNYVWNATANDRVTFSSLENRVDFDNPAAPDYTGRTASVQWERFGPSVDLRFLGGYTSIERELGRDDLNEPNIQAGLTWRMTPTMTMRVDAGQDLRDRSSTLEMGTLDFGTNTQIDSELNEVFLNTRAAIEWEMRLWENLIALELSFDDEEYDDVLFDVQRRNAGIRFERRLTPRFGLRITGAVGEEIFLDAGTDFDRLAYELALLYNPNRRLSMVFSAGHNERESDNAPLNTFEENLYGVSIEYQLLE